MVQGSPIPMNALQRRVFNNDLAKYDCLDSIVWRRVDRIPRGKTSRKQCSSTQRLNCYKDLDSVIKQWMTSLRLLTCSSIMPCSRRNQNLVLSLWIESCVSTWLCVAWVYMLTTLFGWPNVCGKTWSTPTSDVTSSSRYRWRVDRYKSRLVVDGRKQVSNIDYKRIILHLLRNISQYARLLP